MRAADPVSPFSAGKAEAGRRPEGLPEAALLPGPAAEVGSTPADTLIPMGPLSEELDVWDSSDPSLARYSQSATSRLAAPPLEDGRNNLTVPLTDFASTPPRQEPISAEAPPDSASRAQAGLPGSAHAENTGPEATLASSAPIPEARTLTQRYRILEALGVGGMSEVQRVWDAVLERTAAMKIIRLELSSRPEALRRFMREARATARLQHPGIVPIYDLGTLPDNRPFFVMKEVQGTTFQQILATYHGQQRRDPASPEQLQPEWNLWRLTEVLLRVCEAVAYAHLRGVVHLDLKPDNVMIGGFGEVMVLDWGLAALQLGAASPDEPGSPARAGGDPSVSGLAGTPAFIAPERLSAELRTATPRMDVYSLGVMLYELLAGRLPFRGATVQELLVNVLTRSPQALPATTPLELRQICDRAMQRDPLLRYQDAGELARALQAWLTNAQRREQALKLIDQALEAGQREAGLHQRAEAAYLRREADKLRRRVRSYELSELKKEIWALEDQAEQLELKADLSDATYIYTLQSALNLVPDLPEAHRLLADHYHSAHRAAELRRDQNTAARLELLLRPHDDGRYLSYLEGGGALSVVTDPPGAEVELFRFETVDRRLVPRRLPSPGRTPLSLLALERGSYLLELHAKGRATVRYPVHITRGAHWDGRLTGGAEPVPLYLPRQDELGPNDVYVPPGWFTCGGDPQSPGSLPLRRQWLDGFIIKRHPTTNREYLNFLNDLLANGHEEDALRWAPRAASGRPMSMGELLYLRRGNRFELGEDDHGDCWQPDWPVMMITWECAIAYARWESRRTGRLWRLPGELEWEKAARGVDARFFPWGDHSDPTWCCMVDSHAGRSLPAPVDAFPGDESPYGVRGMAGNMRDWCLDPFRAEGPELSGPLQLWTAGKTLDASGRPLAESERDQPRVTRGGYWGGSVSGVRAAARVMVVQTARGAITGFRLASSLDSPHSSQGSRRSGL